VEKRLLPINAIIGLATSDGLNPAPLAEAGFDIAGLEVPCLTTEGGTVVIDGVLANRATGHLLACEAKSGNNVEVGQVGRYKALDARTVVRSTLVTLTTRVDPTLEVVYVAVEANRDRMLLSLSEADAAFPMISVSTTRIELCNREHAGLALSHALGSPVILEAPPGRYIPFDEDSSSDIVTPFVQSELVAVLSQKLPMISIANLTERVVPHYPLYGIKAQGRLRKTVAEAARNIAAEYSENFQYNGPAKNHDGHIKLLRSPEENDPRGRTQGYQRLARRGQSPRRRRQVIEGQGNLLDELEKADDNEDSVASEDTEEGQE
jgi:hypothetical protein